MKQGLHKLEQVSSYAAKFHDVMANLLGFKFM